MSTLLKDIYSPAFYDGFCDALVEVLPAFDRAGFLTRLFDGAWQGRELKERVAHTAHVLEAHFSPDFGQAARQIEDLIAALRRRGAKEAGIEYLFLPHYIERHGIRHFDTAVRALEAVTPFVTCEFAVRPYIVQYGDRMMAEMRRWSLHPDHHVRRLASEGSRPRLPWGMALHAFKKDPTPVLPILENLKNDPSEYVRRSVANNLNDISKDHPLVVMATARKWKGLSPETDALIKHGCRTMLKQGRAEILDYFGLADGPDMEVTGFRIRTPVVKIGGHLEFSFSIANKSPQARTVRLEYGVYYLRQNGSLSKKVFKISERLLPSGDTMEITRRQSFRIITTRRFYPGGHRLSVIVNGQEKDVAGFELVGE